MSMRVAYFTGEYPRATDTFIRREAAALREMGVDVQPFAVRRPHDRERGGAELQAERERTTYLLPASPVALLAAHAWLFAQSPGRYLRAAKLAWSTRQHGVRGTGYQAFYFAEAGLLARHMMKRGIPHVHNHSADSSGTVAMLAAELVGLTFSHTLHGPAIFFEPRRWRLDAKLSRCAFACCISHFARSQAMLFAPQERWDRLYVVHCGVEPAFYQSTRSEAGRLRMLYVGRLAAVKGLPVLLEALEKLAPRFPELSLDIAGDGPERAKLEARARELGLGERVRFLGYQSAEGVRDRLRETDVFVMASFAEGVPVVLMEAMAADVPVVATQVAGVPELVEEGVTGLLVPPGDAHALAAKLVRLLEDASLRRRLGEAGRRKVVREFHVKQEAARLHAILTAELAGRRAELPPHGEPSRDTLAPSARAAEPAGATA